MLKYLNKKTFISVAVILILIIAAVLLSGKGNNAPAPGKGGEVGPSRGAPAGSNAYEDTDYGFSFFYPENFTVGAFSDEENTKTILVQDVEKNIGVQIYISPFDESIALTPERIREDLPDITMNNTQIIKVGGAQAVSFQITNSGIGESREVWLVRTMNLYQLSTPVAHKKILDGIINTWEWGIVSR